MLAELPRGRLRQSVGTDPPSPPDPASHHLREPLLPSNMPFYQLCPLREGARLPWRGPSPPRSLCPAERPSRLHRTSGLVVDEGRAENGDPHSRAPGGRARAGLCTARNQGADCTPRSQGAPAGSWVRTQGGQAGRGWGCGPTPQQHCGCENRSIPEKRRSPARRLGPHAQRDPGRAPTDSRQAFPAGPVVKNLPAQRRGQGSDFCSQKIPRSS